MTGPGKRREESEVDLHVHSAALPVRSVALVSTPLPGKNNQELPLQGEARKGRNVCKGLRRVSPPSVLTSSPSRLRKGMKQASHRSPSEGRHCTVYCRSPKVGAVTPTRVSHTRPPFQQRAPGPDHSGTADPAPPACLHIRPAAHRTPPRRLGSSGPGMGSVVGHGSGGVGIPPAVAEGGGRWAAVRPPSRASWHGAERFPGGELWGQSPGGGGAGLDVVGAVPRILKPLEDGAPTQCPT